MAVLSESNKQQVRKYFEQMAGPVTAVLIRESGETDEVARITADLLGELAELTEHLTWREAAPDSEEAQAWALERYPALVLLDGAGRDRGIRFYGPPLGHEFMTLLEDLIDLSRDQTRFSEEVRAAIQAIDREVTIEVFSTPG